MAIVINVNRIALLMSIVSVKFKQIGAKLHFIDFLKEIKRAIFYSRTVLHFPYEKYHIDTFYLRKVSQ